MDERPEVDRTILGPWARQQDYRQGKHSDEGSVLGEATHQAAGEVDPLQVMHVLGVFYSRSTILGEAKAKNEWVESNYILVVNVYDSSNWILWSKYLYNPSAKEHLLAREAWLGEYAVFPGMEDEMPEKIIYAKVADQWKDLAPDRTLHLTRAHRSRRGQDEPVVTTARWTPRGGIRRENDFSTMGPRLN